MSIITVFAAANLAIPVRAAPLVLAASSKWEIQYADDSCRLARIYGTDKNKIIVLMDRFAPSAQVDVTLIGKPFITGSDVQIPVTFSFGPDLPAAKRKDVLAGFTGKDRVSTLFVGPRDLLNREGDDLPPQSPDDEARITQLYLAVGSRQFVLQSGSLRAPLAALRTCTDDLLKGWGLDPAVQAALSRPPKPQTDPGRWLVSNDYPRGALKMGASAIVHFRLMIGPDGNPTGCNVQQATDSPEFTDFTCKLLMKRAHFEPALDAAGKPTASYYRNSVRWLAAAF
ncbi:energy transducer TonB [Novosphingobium huizhouense]|uniref:energy transducer TonB n=1 Tax=Novosphingobium huizhouense TaxID=2866625 RepID=UPI001CD83E0E|nr:energy transducer TonB [Novosphingobium huizhouense]